MGLKISVAAGALLVFSGCSQGKPRPEPIEKASAALVGPTTWGLAQTLAARGTDEIQALALSDTTFMVGARGTVSIYERGDTDDRWTLAQTLTTDDEYEVAQVDDPYLPSGEFGSSVALSGDTALVGCSRCAAKGLRSGSVYVYERAGQTWTLQQVLNEEQEAADDQFGFAVALDGDSALVTSGKGAHAFSRENGAWRQTATLSLPKLGTAAALSGDVAAVVTNTDPETNKPTGAAYLFTRSSEIWATEPVELSRNRGEARVAIAGGKVMVSTWGYGSGVPYEARHAFTLTFEASAGAAQVGDLDGGGAYIAAIDNSVLVSTDHLSRVGAEGRKPTNLSPALLYPGDGLPEYDFASVPFSIELAMSERVIAFAHADGTITLLTKYTEPEAHCEADAECVSGHCVEGVCCDVACSEDPCKACSAAKKGYGEDGICDWIGSDTQTACGPTECGFHTPFMIETHAVLQAAQCQDRVGCSTVVLQTCDPYRCDSETLSCYTSCTKDEDCRYYESLGYHCVANKCRQGSIPSTGGTSGNDPSSGGTPGDPSTGGTQGGDPSIGGTPGNDPGSGGTPGDPSSGGTPGNDPSTGGATSGGMTSTGEGGAPAESKAKHSEGCSIQHSPAGVSGPWLALAALFAAFGRRSVRKHRLSDEQKKKTGAASPRHSRP